MSEKYRRIYDLFHEYVLKISFHDSDIIREVKITAQSARQAILELLEIHTFKQDIVRIDIKMVFD